GSQGNANVSQLDGSNTTGGTVATFATTNDGGTVTTPSLPFTSATTPTQGELLTYLNTIPALVNNVAVAGLPGGPLTVVYRNALGDTTVSDTALTFPTAGGGSTGTVSTFADGGNATPGSTAALAIGNEVQLISFGGTITSGNFFLNFGGYFTDVIAYSSTSSTLASNIQSALAALPTIGSGT